MGASAPLLTFTDVRRRMWLVQSAVNVCLNVPELARHVRWKLPREPRAARRRLRNVLFHCDLDLVAWLRTVRNFLAWRSGLARLEGADFHLPWLPEGA